MIMKTFKNATKITSVIIGFCFLITGLMFDKQPESSTVFLQTDKINEESEYDCIEAYQTENSTAIEAYLKQVHYIDQR